MANRAGVARFGDAQTTLDTRIGQQGDYAVSELHGRYYEQAVRKNMFFSYCAAQPTSLVTTAMIGNIVWNPPDSGVNLALSKWNSMITVTTAAHIGMVWAVGYQTTSPTGTTVATATGSTFLQLTGATNTQFVAGRARAFSVATVLLAPIAFHVMHHDTVAIAVTGEDVIQGDFEGQIIVPPGHYVAAASLTAAVAAAGHYSHLTWEEVPVL